VKRTCELVAVHSLTWLVVGNAVGLLLATLLLFPHLGTLLGPLTYGRWMPLHTNLLLYGWCSLPLVGCLLKLYGSPHGSEKLPQLAVGLWSGSLLFGAVSWLAGDSSGKLFLDWSGPARGVLAASLGFLALVLLTGLLRRTEKISPLELAPRWLLLLVLMTVPLVLYGAASPSIYPPINPDSGGATGASLLGSTLGLVAVIWGFPFLMAQRPNDGGRVAWQTLAVLGLHFAGFALLGHGDRSHHELPQIVGLASLAIWLPLLIRHLQRFDFPEASRPWLVAFAVWAGLLLATGIVFFLPGMLERLKFTNALVAHAHVAMAGMVTCLNVLILIGLGEKTSHPNLFGDRTAFIFWNGGSALVFGALLILGAVESQSPGMLFRFGSPAGTLATALYLLRWCGGLAMLMASGRWLVAVLASPAEVGELAFEALS
jgi:cytochrome c oxidase cbb3-type subunit 1